MPPSSDDLSKFVVKTDVSADTFQNAASALASGEGADGGAIFNPMEAVAAGIRSGNAIVQMLKVCALLFARGVIAPVEVLLRKNFGERYFNGLVSISAIIVLVALGTCARNGAIYAILLGIEYIGLVSYNGWRCFVRDRKGDYWHSYSEGESRIRIKPADEFLANWNFTFDASTLVFEPLAVLVAGLVCLLLPSSWIDIGFERYRVNPLALYLMVTSVTLFFYQLYCYQYRRNLLLDEKDNGVIAEIRNRITGHTEKAGVFTHKGVPYTILGGKNEWMKKSNS
jgi:hypothetical protein